MNNQLFKALADPTRRDIVRLLGKREMTAGELAEHFDMTRPSMSHHFAVLKEADLIACRREGQHLWYSLNTTVAEEALAWLWDLFCGGTAGQKPKNADNSRKSKPEPKP